MRVRQTARRSWRSPGGRPDAPATAHPKSHPLIDYVLTTAQWGGQALTMAAALGELLADITEAARTIGTLLPAAPNGRSAA